MAIANANKGIILWFFLSIFNIKSSAEGSIKFEISNIKSVIRLNERL